MPHDETIRTRALDWAVRTGDPEFVDWDAFSQWLEADPSHARAYDEVCAAVADAAEVSAPSLPAANDDERSPVPLVRRRWAMGAMAASLALIVGIGMWRADDGRYWVDTAPGEMRTLALADQGSVVLAGGSRIELDRDDARFARLETGQALFTVWHDEKRPFVVHVGEDRLVDAGTVFDVEVSKERMQVAVSEGLVILNPGKQDARIAPGQVLAKRASDGEYTLASVASEQVGEWRQGRLTFDQAPLPVVAERISRMTGVRFEAGSAGGSFSGSVALAPVREDPRSLGALLGASVRREGDRWVIDPD